MYSLAEVRSRGRTVFMSSHVLPRSGADGDPHRRVAQRRGRFCSLRSKTRASSRPVRVRVALSSWRSPLRLRCPRVTDMIDAKPRAWILRVTGQLGSLPSFLATLPCGSTSRWKKPRLEDVLVKYYRDGAE